MSVEKAAKTKSIDSIIEEVVSDVAPPSPIADMGVEVSDGKPEASTPISIDETPKKRKRGRPAKSKPEIEGLTSTVTQPVDASNAGIEPCASLCVMMVNTSGMALGGEAAAMTENEILLAKSGFVAYFQQKGIDNVPAWVLLAGALAPYYLRIITETPAKTTVSNIAGRLMLRAKEYWRERKNARAYNRDNAKRKNDSSENVGGESVK